MPRKKKPKVGRPKGRMPLDDRHYTAIHHLVWSRMTREQIAKEVGVSRMMLWKWTQRKDFQREWDKEHERMTVSIHRKYQKIRTNYAQKALSGDKNAMEWFLKSAGFIA